MEKNPDLDCQQLVGEVYLRKGRFDLAQKSFEKALATATSGSENEAKNLNSLGLIYWNQRDDNKAYEYLRRALEIRLKNNGEEHELTAASYNDLGLVYGRTDKRKALANYDKALSIYEKVLGAENAKSAQTKINIGIIYRDLLEFNKAETNFREALKIWQTLYPEGHPNEGFIYTNLALTSNAIGVVSLAESNFKKALDVYLKHYGYKHPEVAATYNYLGRIRNQEGEFEEAITLYQKALIANSKDFDDTDPSTNPSVSSFFNAGTMLATLFYKAQAFEDWHYNVTLKLNDLKSSLYALQACDTLIDQIRRLQSNEADKLAFSGVVAQVFETGVRVAYRMGEVAVKGRAEYNELAFYFNEKSKSGILLDAIADASAKSFASIPDDLLTTENTLKEEISFYERKIAEKPVAKKEKEYRDILFALTQKYAAFIKDLEANYPQYFNLKYNNNIPTISDLQSTLDEKTALYSYFLDDKNKRIFTFIITKKKFNIINIPQTEQFDKYLTGLRNSIYYKDDKTYVKTAQALGKLMFSENISSEISHLIVIPVGKLGAFPFESLILDKVKGKTIDLTTLPYLGRSYAISYEYAAALYFQEATIEARANKGNLALLCAPVEFESLPRLPGTAQEIQELEAILSQHNMNANVYMEKDANETSLLSADLKQFKYLHFATHGIVDEVNPELSRIYLAKSEDGSDDGNLYSGEIYNIELAADLVTLSACETGLGKVSKGEGIIGLSRALLYAGAENIVVSLWAVSDESTAKLMINFYDNMEGSDYSEALRKAKLSLMSDAKYASPYYWAPFILIGK